MADAAPQADTSKTATCAHSIADLSSGNVDLTAISLKGAFASQLIRLNNGTAGNLSAIMTPENGSDITVVVNAGQSCEVTVPIKTIKNTSGALSALCYWWLGATLRINK
jgi:hypothetical protein